MLKFHLVILRYFEMSMHIKRIQLAAYLMHLATCNRSGKYCILHIIYQYYPLQPMGAQKLSLILWTLHFKYITVILIHV